MPDARVGRGRTFLGALLSVALLGCGDSAPSSSPVLLTPTVTAPATIAPTPDATVVPPLSPPLETTSPILPTGAAHWVPVSTLNLKYELELAGASGFDDGYVLLVDGAARFSPDGTKWKAIRLPAEGAVAYPSAVATNGPRVVVVGATSACQAGAWSRGWDEFVSPWCRMRPASWVSDDGRTWHRSGDWTGRIHLDADERNGSQFVRVWAVPTGGFDAMQAFWSGDMEEDPAYERPILWHSDDGLAWTRLGVLPTESWFYEDEVPWGGADASGRRVIVDAEEEACSLWSSADGDQYQELSVEGPCEYRWVTAPPADTTWILLDSQDGRPAARSSIDLANWVTSPMPAPESESDVFPAVLAWSRHALVAVAWTRPDGTDAWAELTWLSDDGRSWQLADVSTQIGWGDLIRYLADGPAGLLAFASDSEPDEVHDWYDTTITVWQMKLGPGG